MSKKILLVDDSITQLTSLKLALSKSGCEVLTAKNGNEGIFITYQVLPDLIIADIIMPEINGYQFCRLLKNEKETRNIPIILITNLNEKLDKFWALRTGADAFLTKDKDLEKLLVLIETFIKDIPVISEEERQKILAENQLFTPSCIQAKIKHILDQSLIESTIMNELRNLVEFVPNSKILNRELLILLTSILDYNIAGVFFNDRDDKKEKNLILSLYNSNFEKDVLEKIKEDFFTVMFPDVSVFNKDLYTYEIFEKVNENPESNIQFQDLKSRVIIPIIHMDKVFGGICLYYTSSDKFKESKVLNIIVEELKILMRIRWLYSETKFLTIIDGLTGLYNRRYFQQALERELSRAKRYGTDLSIAMFDIDHFKKINDVYGHQFGDKILVEISDIARNSFRRTDYVTRYGGEEFVLILPETNIEKALIPIERLRKRIEDENFVYGDCFVKATISVGIANLTSDIKSDRDLIKKADTALYTAKENGRNRIEFYSE